MKNIFLFSLLTLAFCNKPPKNVMMISDISVFATKAGKASGYFTLNNSGNSAILLQSVRSGGIEWEIHDTIVRDGMATMEIIQSAQILPQSSLIFKKGGKHISGKSKVGSELELEFRFSNGSVIKKSISVKSVGDISS